MVRKEHWYKYFKGKVEWIKTKNTEKIVDDRYKVIVRPGEFTCVSFKITNETYQDWPADSILQSDCAELWCDEGQHKQTNL